MRIKRNPEKYYHRIDFACAFVLFYLLPYLGCFAQNPVLLTDSIAAKSAFLDKSGWRFHPGDDLQWAQPGFNDSSWAQIERTGFGRDKFSRAEMPGNWTGFGWFRLWITKQNHAATDTWGLSLNHDGASEVYFDGKKVATLGKLGHSREEMVAVREPYLSIPFAINDTLPHLIAIRYSNYLEYYPNFVGFNSRIQGLHEMAVSQKNEQQVMGQLLMSVSVSVILVLLHFLIYIFYPRQKIHLYYILFVSVVAMGLYARYQTIVATDPAQQVLATKFFLAFVTLHLSLGLLLLYYACYGKLPVRKTIIMLLCSWPVAVFAVVYWYEFWYNTYLENLHNGYQVIFILIFYTDAFVAMVRAIRGGNKKLSLLAGGMVVLVVTGIFVGSNMFGWFTLQQVMISFAWGNLIMPILFSVYLAIDVAATNRSLAFQLNVNEKLAADNLAKEQEKIRLMAGQAEELEKTVLERTAQVREQAEKLREMDSAKSSFFVNLTHEFKTPLTLIINPAKELLQHTSEAASRRYAQFILQNSERLLQLINQLLDLSKLESKQLQVSTQPIELVQWLRNYVLQHGSLADHRNIQLHFSSGQARMWLHADMDKMEKMVQNLLSNAIKFSDDHGEITVSLRKIGTQEFTITVSDNGMGIPADKLSYVFDRFYQTDSSHTRRREGAGIGLSLTKELAELLGGTVTVTSSEDKGSIFVLTLPYHQAAEEHMVIDLAEEERTVSQAKSIRFSQEPANDELPLILLVEDNADLREFISLSLSSDYRFITAQDGEEGIQAAFEKIPLLVITDLMIPQKDGYEVCATLKKDERTSHIPIVMLTAKTDADSRILGIETGADAYLPKPFDKRELLAVTENLIRIRKQLREKYGKDNVWLTGVEDLPSIEQQFLNKVREAVAGHLDDSSFGADQLASHIALSRTQLHRKLTQLINQSPGELIRNFRMQRAHELLQKSVGSVGEVGYMVGYANPANFSTTFAKHFGYPPSEAGKRG